MFKWLKTNYQPQALSDKQKELIAAVDNELVKLHNDKNNAGEMKMKIHERVIPLIYTPLPVSMLVKKLDLGSGDMYIPRSVAFITNTSGDWVVLYAVRVNSEAQGSGSVTTTLFIDALNRTNSARN